MSFWFLVYYSAVVGAGGALLGWALALPASGATALLAASVQGFCVGLCLAAALCLADTHWNLSLRQPGLAWQRAAVAGIVGGVGGFLGGLIGQMLAGVSAVLAYGIGWTLAGAFVGAGPGLFDVLLAAGNQQDAAGPRRKALQGVAAGAAGGYLGGMLFAFFHEFGLRVLFVDKAPDQLWSHRTLGFAAFGGTLGLLSGLAQVLFRDCWLRVEGGESAGRELLLWRPLLLLGQGEACDLALTDRRVEKVHARLERRGASYVLSDAGSLSGLTVNGQHLDGPRLLHGGDRIRIGDCQLRYGERPLE